MVAMSGRVQRGATIVLVGVLRLDVRAKFEQRFNGLEVSLPRSAVERGRSIRFSSVQQGRIVDRKSAYRGHIAVLCRADHPFFKRRIRHFSPPMAPYYSLVISTITA